MLQLTCAESAPLYPCSISPILPIPHRHKGVLPGGYTDRRYSFLSGITQWYPLRTMSTNTHCHQYNKYYDVSVWSYYILCIVPMKADWCFPLKRICSVWLYERTTLSRYNACRMNRISIGFTHFHNWTLHIRNHHPCLLIHTDHSPKDSHSTVIE